MDTHTAAMRRRLYITGTTCVTQMAVRATMKTALSADAAAAPATYRAASANWSRMTLNGEKAPLATAEYSRWESIISRSSCSVTLPIRARPPPRCGSHTRTVLRYSLR